MKTLAPMRVMVVDDTETNIDILLETLGDDYRIVVALDGESALEDIARTPPDLILLDIMMPGMDGYEVCRKLKEGRKTRSIPVIFLTAMQEAGDEAHGLALGAVDYITKPFNPDLVRARVKNHLELKRHRDHLEKIVEARTKEIAQRQRVEYELRAAQDRIESELEIAAQIQTSFLPSGFPAFPEYDQFDLSAVMIPAREVGGDFYDFFFVDDSHLAVIIADVSDKSIPAALYMMVVRTMFRSLARQFRSPARVMAEVNRLICAENETGMFVTALLAYYDTHHGYLIWTSAGHCPPYLIGGNGTCQELSLAQGVALGLKTSAAYHANDTVITPGQKLFLYTDGVIEAVAPDREMFGSERLKQYLDSMAGDPPARLLNKISETLMVFQKGDQFDDFTMLVLERKL